MAALFYNIFLNYVCRITIITMMSGVFFVCFFLSSVFGAHTTTTLFLVCGAENFFLSLQEKIGHCYKIFHLILINSIVHLNTISSLWVACFLPFRCWLPPSWPARLKFPLHQVRFCLLRGAAIVILNEKRKQVLSKWSSPKFWHSVFTWAR
jgi:hypothetical protein